MEVSIYQTAFIYPSEFPFVGDHFLPLSTLDTDPNLNVTFRYLRAYINSPHKHNASSPVQVISSALSRALVKYYPLSGTLQPQPPDQRLSLFCVADADIGVPLICATANCTLESVSYFENPTGPFIEQLVFDPDKDEASWPAAIPLVLQVTVFDCGGYTLGASIHHALCDGMGATLFFNAMAELARGADQVSIEPVWDRAVLLGPRNPPRVEAGLDKVLHLDKDFLAYASTENDNRKFTRECFDIQDDCMEKFKNELLENSGVTFTTFEALGAYIWRARIKASGIAGEEMVKFAYSMNIRKLVKPPLPIGYWGNGCVPVYVQLSAEELLEKPIWETAEMIKKSKKDATEEYVRSFIDFQAMNYGKGLTAGKGVSAFTDWRHLGHSTVDFGWGGPVTVLPLSRHLLGSAEPCFFLPYSSVIEGKQEGFKALVTLAAAALSAFRQEMEKFSRKEFGLASSTSL